MTIVFCCRATWYLKHISTKLIRDDSTTKWASDKFAFTDEILTDFACQGKDSRIRRIYYRNTNVTKYRRQKNENDKGRITKTREQTTFCLKQNMGDSTTQTIGSSSAPQIKKITVNITTLETTTNKRNHNKDHRTFLRRKISVDAKIYSVSESISQHRVCLIHESYKMH